MKPDAREAIRKRVSVKMDLSTITHQDAVYAIFDRALLWAELEHSLARSLANALAFVGTPALMISLGLWWAHTPWYLASAPLLLALLLLFGTWCHEIIQLAAEGHNARLVRTMSAAVKLSPPLAAEDTQPAPAPAPEFPPNEKDGP